MSNGPPSPHQPDDVNGSATLRAYAEATREIMRLVAESRHDEQPVFDAILEAAGRLCDAPLALLGIADEAAGTLPLRAHRGTSAELLRFFEERPIPLDDDRFPASRCLNRAEVLHFPDFSKEPVPADLAPMRENTNASERARTVLFIPIAGNDLKVGVIVLYRRDVKLFADAQIALIQTFADQAVIAIENARQFRELQTKLEHEAATRDLLSVISQSRDDEQPVFEMIVKSAARLCHSPRIALTLVDEARENIVLRALWEEDYEGQPLGGTMPLTDPGVAAVAVREGRVVHDVNIADSDLYRQGHEVRRKLVDELGVQTLLSVPINSGTEAIGSINLIRREPGPFPDQQIALVESFAAQAVIAIENVRQFRELQTRLEREAATREILSVISQSPNDEQPVFDAIVEWSAKLCGSSNALLSLVDEARENTVWVAAWGDRYRSLETGEKVSLSGANLHSLAVRKQCVAEVADIADTDLYRQGDPLSRRMVDEEGVRSLLVVPLISSDQVIGVIGLRHHEPGPFNEDQIALLETFAAQAVIAIENVRQFREIQFANANLSQALERQTATSEVLDVISQSQSELQPVLDKIASTAANLCRASSAGVWRLTDGWFEIAAHTSDDPTLTDFFREHPSPYTSEGVLSRAVALGEPIHIHDVRDDAELSESQRLRRSGARTFLVVPMISPDGEPTGCINLSRHTVQPFDEAEIALIQTFADQATIAIENVRLFNELNTRLEREAATREILSVISQSPDDENPVFDVILERTAQLSGSPMAHLLLLDNETSDLVIVADWGIRFQHFVPGTSRIPLDSSYLVAECVRDMRVIQTEDLADTEPYRAGDPNWVALVDEENIRTFLRVPLTSGKSAIGVIVVCRQEVNPFSPDEIALVESFAAQAVIAIENVRQFRALETLNAELGDRVADQVGEIERMGKLKRFLSPAVAAAVVSSGGEDVLSSHRALIGILFCDIRGFTAFCEAAEPEETIEFLQTYHEEMGNLINAHGAGVDNRWGDGIMVIFNDPFPCEDPAGDALRLAIAMREKMVEICGRWKRLGYRLGFGVGISLGYATVGMVGSAGRFDYTANGTAVNMAARLCDHAEDGDILLSPRAYTAVEDDFQAESTGEMTFKGIRQPVEVFRVTGPTG